MAIRELVDDSRYLAERGRYLGALNLILAAVSGSSRKVFPQGRPSIENPADPRGMGDREAFTRFLGRRICEVMTNAHFEKPEDTGTLISMLFEGRNQTIQEILYKQFRCSLTHEGKLPATVSFDEKKGFNPAERSIQLAAMDGVVRLEQGWLGLLMEVVTHAPCNGEEFDIPHFTLQPKPGVNPEEVRTRLSQRFGLSPARLRMLETLVMRASPERVVAASHAALNGVLRDALNSGALNGGQLTALAFDQLATHEGELTSAGVDALRELAGAFELVRVT